MVVTTERYIVTDVDESVIRFPRDAREQSLAADTDGATPFVGPHLF
jgi:hypothetical protein